MVIWLTGQPGSGKTTLAKIIVNHIDCDYLYINASDENSVDVVREKVKGFASTMGFKDYKIIILDECDYITPNAQAALRNLMETFSKHCRFILTCNFVERIIDPIQSRCQSFQIIPPDRKQIAVHVMNILKNENVSCKSEDIVTLVNGGYPDIRRVINAAQRQIVGDELIIDESEVILNDYKLKVLEILKDKTISKKDSFVQLRKVLADAKVTDFADLFRLLFDSLDDFATGKMAQIILIIAKYELSDAQVVDKEINAMAMLIEILQELK